MRFYYSLLFLLVGYTATCQSTLDSKYVVVTLERERTNDNHAIENAYWVVSADSLKKLDTSLVPLYLHGFSSNNFKECCNEGTINIFYYTDSTGYKFDEGYKAIRKSLIDLVKEKRKKVQTITKEWPKGVKEKINVYLTPVDGSFCRCRIDKEGSKKIEYEGIIMMPKSGFTFAEDFWSSNKSDQIKSFDFSSLSFLNLHSIL